MVRPTASDVADMTEIVQWQRSRLTRGDITRATYVEWVAEVAALGFVIGGQPPQPAPTEEIRNV